MELIAENQTVRIYGRRDAAGPAIAVMPRHGTGQGRWIWLVERAAVL